MLENVLKSPMSFFDTNPKGRVVNRFAKDVDYVDRAIPMTLEALLRLLFQVNNMHSIPRKSFIITLNFDAILLVLELSGFCTCPCNCNDKTLIIQIVSSLCWNGGLF